jgi:hypothetical protein
MESHRIVELDGAGRIRAFLIFDGDDRAGAFTALAERWARQDDAPPPVLSEFLRRWNAHDPDALGGLLAPDFVFDDHRRTGIGRTNREGWLTALAALWELGPDTRLDTLHAIEHKPEGLLALAHWWGTNAEGGAFESVFVHFFRVGFGRLQTIELFEVDDLELARARFEALRPDPLAIPPPAPANAAMRSEARWTRAVIRRDWDAVRRMVRSDFVFEDRGRRALVRGDVEAWIASADYTTSLPGIRIDKPQLAAIGERVAIDHVHWRGSPGGDGFEFERIRVLEVDGEGLFAAALLFDPEDATAASVEAFARFVAGEAAGSPSVAGLLAFVRALVERDWAAARARFAPGLVFEDHRPLGLGGLSGDTFVASIEALDELGSEIITEILQVIAWNAKGAVVSVRRRGKVRDGGAFESRFLAVTLGTAERFVRYEVFGEDEVERARARFEALTAGDA